MGDDQAKYQSLDQKITEWWYFILEIQSIQIIKYLTQKMNERVFFYYRLDEILSGQKLNNLIQISNIIIIYTLEY